MSQECDAYEEHIRQAALVALNNPAPKRTTAQVDETIKALRERLERERDNK